SQIPLAQITESLAHLAAGAAKELKSTARLAVEEQLLVREPEERASKKGREAGFVRGRFQTGQERLKRHDLGPVVELLAADDLELQVAATQGVLIDRLGVGKFPEKDRDVPFLERAVNGFVLG